MSQLIALIIAIALGAIVTAIGYVFLGDAFTSNSERGVALQFVNQGSQVEMAMTAFRASNAASAWDTDSATTLASLENSGFLKSGLVAPQGDYVLVQDAAADNSVYLTVQSADLTDAVCGEIEELAGRDATLESSAFAGVPTGAEVTTALGAIADGSQRYLCIDDATTATNNVFIYEVE